MKGSIPIGTIQEICCQKKNRERANWKKPRKRFFKLLEAVKAIEGKTK